MALPFCHNSCWLPHEFAPSQLSREERVSHSARRSFRQPDNGTFFLFGLRHFEHSARRAFALVCAGMVLYGIGTAQFPIINIVGGEEVWVRSGAALVPFVLAVSFQYFGVRRFGRLMLVKSRWFAWPWVYAGACIAAALMLVIPGSSPIMIAQAWLLTIILVTVFAISAIRAKIANRYRPALSWHLAGNAMVAFSAFHQVILSFIQSDNWYVASGISSWPFAVTALLMARTGYEFARIEANLTAPVVKKTNPVEVVLYVASLVSDPSAVDGSLDRVRAITSSSTYNSTVALSGGQEAALAKTYKEIESYLVHDDPLLRFDAASLRESIGARFDIQDTSSPFWRLFRA